MLARLFWAVFLTAAASAAVFPGAEWETASPESQGVDPERLAAAVAWFESNAPRDGAKELAIVRNGYLIHAGPEIDKQHGVWSATKSFTSTVLGLLIDDGECSLDTRAADIAPEMEAAYPRVTLRNFTTMTSGYHAVGDEPRGSYSHGPSSTPFEPAEQPLFEPGTHYAYWDSAMNQFGHVLTRLAEEPLEEFFRRRVADPIGMNPRAWDWGDLGEREGMTINGGSGNSSAHVFISAREMARVGWLYLNEGRWNDKQLISSDWVRQATGTQVPATLPLGHLESGIEGPGMYGFNWWTNSRKPDGERKWPGAPAGAYAASGHNNNDMFVIPAWNMVVVRLGLDQSGGDGAFAIGDATYAEFLRRIGEAITDATLEGERRVWHPQTLSFRGPAASETDDAPNPFLDYRLEVVFGGPSGQTYRVPGYFDGDGRGGSAGEVWRVRFSPDEPGEWTWSASFRTGDEVAVSLDPGAGERAAFDGAKGRFEVLPRNPDAAGFRSQGRLEYVGEHYLKFRDGSYWIRGGADSPENLLAYEGFDNTPASHRFADHVEDWAPGDPDWGGGRARGIVGAVNYLASKQVNSIYFLLMNIGGDGGDVWPWAGRPEPKGAGTDDNLHFDLSKLRQWETVFDHAERKGVFLHAVFNEAEEENKRELDDGELGVERKLYYREMIARFGHHLALEWNLCEEYNLQFDLGPERSRQFAAYIRAVDSYDHPLTIHSARDPREMLAFTFGDPLFSLTSIQLNQRRIDTLVEELRAMTTAAGRPLPISMDEFTVDVGQEQSHIPFDRADLQRKQKLWPTYMSGGMIEFILEGLLEMDSFKTPERDKLWDAVRYARLFFERHLPFWKMEPADSLVEGESMLTVGLGKGETFELDAQVFVKPGEVYAVYYPDASKTGALDLTGVTGGFVLRWFSPRSGLFEGAERSVTGGAWLEVGPPPNEAGEDWTLLLERVRTGGG